MSYNLLIPFKFITNGDMSADITSDAIEIKNQDNVGIQLNWTGIPVGDFSVEISIDHKQDIDGNIQVEGHWVTLPLSPSISAAGSDDSAYIDLNQMSANYVRVVYTFSSDTGSLDAYITAKGV